MNTPTRRTIIRGAAAVTALSYGRILGANDRVRMGYIGLGNRGDQVHDAFLEFGDSQTVAVCDLREDYLDLAVKKSRNSPNRYKDYRKLLDDKNVDAVVIATPDHWHAIQFIDACNAGKDVYVEKPFSLTVVEGRRMVETAERTKRIVQVGLQRRSSKMLQEAAEFVRSGGIGHVTVAKGYHLQNEWPNGIGATPDTNPPTEQEWDMWLGPAPKIPYNPNRTYYRFRWFYNYSGGQVTNFGVHYVDMLRWCLGQDAPNAVTALGGRYAVKDNREIPDTCEILWEYPGPTMVVFSQYNANNAPANPPGREMELRGTMGTMYVDLNGWEVVPQRTTETLVPARIPTDREHERAYGPSRKQMMEPRAVKGRVDNQA
ncbi:MAG TPA: Gfo/Idh/MocA family oxidoreductase, partial [Bryobacteraceae bacterium]|nr:Gfo/Idh/MocA family oxidoreductase [Bryobacteraceae bacterium]